MAKQTYRPGQAFWFPTKGHDPKVPESDKELISEWLKLHEPTKLPSGSANFALTQVGFKKDNFR